VRFFVLPIQRKPCVRAYSITTDLEARGLDIPEMNHVIHLPSKEDEFTHRNGRTARMLSTGTAYIIAHE
jgi:superfamily II DNA/RNA helicase